MTSPTTKKPSVKKIASAHKSLLPEGAGKLLRLEKPIKLDCGETLEQVDVAYETYGALNLAKNNAILICHPLTADQFVASDHPVTGKPGWWADMIGPDKLIDTNRFFVICANVLGGCMGTTGPSSINPATGKIYGLDLPIITIGDMVETQVALIESLGIESLMAVIGGSMGGFQVLEWVARYPEKIFAAAPIATASRQSPQNIAFHEIGRQAIMADPHWQGGAYYDKDNTPIKGLSVARMTAHVTYLSEEALDRKFGRRLQDREQASFSFDADFQIESYLRHQGLSFVDRFDANAYLYITRAMDYFDIAAHKPLSSVFQNTTSRFLLCSFSSDWLYPTAENKRIVHALHGVSANVSFVEIESDKGHDAFLLEEPEFYDVMAGFIRSVARERGVK